MDFEYHRDSEMLACKGALTFHIPFAVVVGSAFQESVNKKTVMIIKTLLFTNHLIKVVRESG